MPFLVNGKIDQFLAEMVRIPLLTPAEEITLGTVTARSITRGNTTSTTGWQTGQGPDDQSQP